MTATFTKDVTFDVEIEYNIKATSDVANFENKNKRTEKITISGEKLEHSRLHLSDTVGCDLTMEQMLEVIFSDVNLIKDFNDVSRPDTATKFMFANAFGKFILQDGRHWPLGGDSREYTEKFFKDLEERAVELGYVKIPN